MTDWELHEGDAREVLRTLPAASIGALVTDPPAGINFMNRAFDSDRGGRRQWVAWLAAIMAEALRVAKPGAHGFVWALPRTSHWTATALEDAGWEIRDICTHIFGSGFPKSKDLGEGRGSALKPANEHWILIRKPIDAPNLAANVARHGVGALAIDQCRVGLPEDKRAAGTKRYTPSQMAGKEPGDPEGYLQDAPHDGLGRWPTNLVLTHSPLCVPTGTRRVRGTANTPRDRKAPRFNGSAYAGDDYSLGMQRGDDAINGYADADGLETVAAWSCVENCPVAILDAQAGERKSGKAGQGGHRRTGPSGSIYGPGKGLWREEGPAGDLYGDTGSVSRFYPTFAFEADDFAPMFYAAKASRRERNAGLERLPGRGKQEVYGKGLNTATKLDPKLHTAEGVANRPEYQNNHPTVKPLALMRWLVRLVCPPGEICLDPFAGSGTTGVACILEGRGFVGIEREAAYMAISRRRLETTQPALPGLRGDA